MLYLISSFICIAYYLYVGFKCQSTMFSYQIMKNNTGFIIKQRSFCWLLSGKAHGLSAQYVTEMIIILHLSLSLFKQNFATIHLTLAFPGKGKGSVVLLVFTKVLLIFLFTPIYSAGPVIGPPGAVAPWEGGSITGHAITVPPHWGWVKHMQLTATVPALYYIHYTIYRWPLRTQLNLLLAIPTRVIHIK